MPPFFISVKSLQVRFVLQLTVVQLRVMTGMPVQFQLVVEHFSRRPFSRFPDHQILRWLFWVSPGLALGAKMHQAEVGKPCRVRLEISMCVGLEIQIHLGGAGLCRPFFPAGPRIALRPVAIG